MRVMPSPPFHTLRHAELGSASTVSRKRSALVARWTLKHVQGDGGDGWKGGARSYPDAFFRLGGSDAFGGVFRLELGPVDRRIIPHASRGPCPDPVEERAHPVEPRLVGE